MSNHSHQPPHFPRIIWFRARNPRHLNISEAPIPVVVVSENDHAYMGGAILENKRCDAFGLWFKSIWEEAYMPETQEEDEDEEEDTRPHRTTVRIANGGQATVEL